MTRYATMDSGQVVTCDGCAAPILADYDEATQVWPVPADLCRAVYGRTDLVYIVCPPPAGETWNPCLNLARLADEGYEAIRCRVPNCDGRHCGTRV